MSTALDRGKGRCFGLERRRTLSRSVGRLRLHSASCPVHAEGLFSTLTECFGDGTAVEHAWYGEVGDCLTVANTCLVREGTLALGYRFDGAGKL